MNHCAYLRQFGQEGDFFAPMPLLRATGWWQRAGVVVLDEFDPASLLNLIQLDATGLAAMGRAHHQLWRWAPGRSAGTWHWL